MSIEENAGFSKTDTSHHAGAGPSSPPGQNLGAAALGNAPRNLDSLEFVMDVPVEVSVEIGRKKMRIAEILRVGTGSVLELNKSAGEPLDIYVNNRVVARGEAVVVGDHYGVRLTEVLISDDRNRGGEQR
ncbi:MAG TPA: flagellar motor switch protein FliN [Polyangiaceae bacterium]|jgi:flagellar motor switch protein FliN/FliY|nr:flagellar motor switch protein FliN [Polyangiaceae bacterium]